MTRRAAIAATAVLSAALVGCGTSSGTDVANRAANGAGLPPAVRLPATADRPTTPIILPVPPATTAPAPATTAAPAPTSPEPSAFVGAIFPVTAADLPYTYRDGCPVPPEELRMLYMSYWGFDGQPHLGAMVVRDSVTQDVLTVFAALYGERFPIRKMLPVDEYEGNDPASMDDDNTSGFNCREAVGASPPQWSAHAYGEAIDVNTVENPYVLDGVPQPAAGAAYLDRSDVRPGMAVAGGQLVAAFASVGWQWGGRWTDSPDYQHFSKTGG